MLKSLLQKVLKVWFHKGTTKNVVYQLVGGLKSSMGYTGHKTIKKMQNNCKFVFISKAGARESNVHDVLL